MTVTRFTWTVRRGIRVATAAVVLIGILSASESRLAAQRRPNAPAAAPNVPQGVSPEEFDQLFNSFVLMQAQQELRLRDDQYGPFATRLRNLQMVRRRAQNQRMRVINELRRLTQADVDGGVDENQIREQLRTLDEVETRTAAEVHQAQANLDQCSTRGSRRGSGCSRSASIARRSICSAASVRAPDVRAVHAIRIRTARPSSDHPGR
jgi:hypothetical protein